jgi:phage tail sheath protein FI
MVQLNHPGVYIREVSSGAHAIIGVSTSVTAFVGSTVRGPVDKPTSVFSMAEYSRLFGPPMDEEHPLAHEVSLFFANGGSEAVIVRVAHGGTAATTGPIPAGTGTITLVANGPGTWASDVGGTTWLSTRLATPPVGTGVFDLTLTLRRRDPNEAAPTGGQAPNGIVEQQETYSSLSIDPTASNYWVNALAVSRLVAPAVVAGTIDGVPDSGTYFFSSQVLNQLTTPGANEVQSVTIGGAPTGGTFTLKFGAKTTPGIAFDAFAADVQTALEALTTIGTGNVTVSGPKGGPYSVTFVGGLGAATQPAMTKNDSGLTGGTSPSVTVAQTTAGAAPVFTALLAGAAGTDPADPGPADLVPAGGTGAIYSLDTRPFPPCNLLCVPELTMPNTGTVAELSTAIAWCTRNRVVMLIDPEVAWVGGNAPNMTGIQEEHAALYYPRLKLRESLPSGGFRDLNLPPSGAVAGVIARIDSTRGFWKAPAGLEASIAGTSGFQTDVDDNLSGQLNPRGVNALRTFRVGGPVIWGARTGKGDDGFASEYKYLPIRRTADYIASSLYLGTTFAVFEPNDPDLWAQLRSAVTAFMRGLFRLGAFQQSAKKSESDSFFVICDATNNPQDEIDRGIVNVTVGFAPLKPAEFVVITITQMTRLEA